MSKFNVYSRYSLKMKKKKDALKRKILIILTSVGVIFGFITMFTFI
jgi:hypothetical protein